MKAIREGALEPPIDGRTVRIHRDEPKRDHARSFYQWLYDHLAEPLAEGLDPEFLQDLQEIEEEELMDEFSEWIKVDPRAAPSESNQNPVAAASLQPSQKEQRPGSHVCPTCIKLAKAKALIAIFLLRSSRPYSLFVLVHKVP